MLPMTSSSINEVEQREVNRTSDKNNYSDLEVNDDDILKAKRDTSKSNHCARAASDDDILRAKRSTDKSDHSSRDTNGNRYVTGNSESVADSAGV